MRSRIACPDLGCGIALALALALASVGRASFNGYTVLMMAAETKGDTGRHGYATSLTVQVVGDTLGV